MKFLMVSVDMKGMSNSEMDGVPERIDEIVKPYHLEWSFLNLYSVVNGYDEDLAVRAAKKALEQTDWLKDKVFAGIMQSISRCRLDEICVEGMTEPRPEKLEKYRAYFEEHGISEYDPTYPNPIVVDRDKNLLDGYISYLIMKEKGYTYADCLLAEQGTVLKKYISGIHIPGTSKKEYSWSYSLRDAVVPGDLLLVDTKQGKKLVRVMRVDMGTAGYVDGLRKVKKNIGQNQNREYA